MHYNHGVTNASFLFVSKACLFVAFVFFDSANAGATDSTDIGLINAVVLTYAIHIVLIMVSASCRCVLLMCGNSYINQINASRHLGAPLVNPHVVSSNISDVLVIQPDRCCTASLYSVCHISWWFSNDFQLVPHGTNTFF